MGMGLQQGIIIGEIFLLATCTVSCTYVLSCYMFTVADPGGIRGVQMHPPFEDLLLRVLSKSAQT